MKINLTSWMDNNFVKLQNIVNTKKAIQWSCKVVYYSNISI